MQTDPNWAVPYRTEPCRTVPYHAVEKRHKAFSSHPADPSNLQPVMHQSKIAVETKCNSIKIEFLNIRSLKNNSFLINDLITTNNLDFMFLNETWLEDTCSATVLNETAPPNFNFISVCRTVRRGGGLAAIFKDFYQSLPITLVLVVMSKQ